jgi:hypothetical protein
VLIPGIAEFVWQLMEGLRLRGLGSITRQRQGISMFSVTYRSALGPTQCPILRVPGAVSSWENGESVKQVTQLNSILRTAELYRHAPIQPYGVVFN